MHKNCARFLDNRLLGDWWSLATGHGHHWFLKCANLAHKVLEVK
jgi:hypothetical protein